MKIAQYHGPRGKQDNVQFIKGEARSVLRQHWDRIYITTLFSFEWKKIARSIDFALEAANGQSDKVFVGGIAASLMTDRFQNEAHWSGIRFIQGLLDKPPAISLQLDEFCGELYAEDTSSMAIEDYIPDYSILDQIDYRYPVSDAYFTYASRGCVRKCKFCGVPKLEGEQRDTESLSKVVAGIEKLYGPKKDLILMDNNVVASTKFKKIIAEIRDLGFTAGAKLKRGRSSAQRRVDFNQGVDARILCKDKIFLEQLSTICLRPLRIAFDHVGVRKPYEQAIRYAYDVGLHDLSNYMLYNFFDSPEDLFERMRMNVSLNEELGIRIFSFPMRYQPTDRPTRDFVGPNWNAYWLRSMQIILQATHGIVSGAPDFFKHAFGDTYKEYIDILTRPHAYIFNRNWFERHGGRKEFDEYLSVNHKLSGTDRDDLLEVLKKYNGSNIEKELKSAANKSLRKLSYFYRNLQLSEAREIWEQAKALRTSERDLVDAVPDDERVEDACLDDEEV